MSDEEKQRKEAEDLINNASKFVQLVLSFHAAAWQQMGKVTSVITGEIDRNLIAAKHSIDMLAMLEEKTKGNLTEDEEKYLKHALYELRMNYLEEAKKDSENNESDKTPPDDSEQSEKSESGEGE
jgi:hypothetical protein